MGVIKKLKGRELVGWQQNPEVDVYPITNIGAVFNDQSVPLSDILNGLQQQISGGSGGGSSASTYPINYLWAYTTARTDSEALSKLNRSEQVNVPTNFVGNTSFTVPDGYYIYMTTARNQGGVYLRWEDNSIWSVPVRIGSGYTTSYTGNDGEGYNYAYCRTNNATPPNIPASLTVVRLGGLSDNQGISASDGSISYASYNVWYDHPLGVDGTYQWEWVAISRGSDNAGWSAYTGPTLWSKFGVDGRDGDGIEYIFTALAEEAPTPQFINKYNGRIGEQSSDYREVLIENCTSDSFYQQDDFIPSGWHDTPQILSQSYNKQYVSVRKKRFTNENEGYWGHFSQPVLWAKISSSAITMTLDSDAVILDDNTSSTSTKIVSCTGIHIWDGDREITTDPNYYIEITASPINSIDDILILNVVSQIEGNQVHTIDIQDPDYNNGYGYNFTYSVDTFQSSLGMMFCLSRLDEFTAMNEGAYAIGYTARIYNRDNRTVPIAEITKAQSVQIVNINDGTSYMMQVSPNSLPVSRVNSASLYTFTGDNQIDITVKACSGTEVTSCNIYNSNQGEGKLYVTVRAYNAQGPTSVEYASYLSGNGSDIISYTLSDAGNNCLYYIVNLYYVSEGVARLVETETVNLVIKGDDGVSAYTLSMSNDSAIIDEQTVDAASLAVATANQMTVYEGVVDITSRCTFGVTSSSLPTGLSVSNNGRDFKLVPNSDIRGILDEGNYSYTVTAYIDDVPVAVKMFKFIVRNITADGVVFKLNITNDTWQYDGDTGASITTQRSSVSVSSIASGTSQQESFTMISSSDSIPTTGLVVVYPVTLSSLVDTSSKLITPYGEFTGNGWDLQLYYNAVLVDSEHIGCVKNGATGATPTAQQGLRGAVVRNRGEWSSDNVTYCYNTDMEGNGPAENNTVYIDIVYYNGNTYQCIQHHTSISDRAPGNTSYWTVAQNIEFLATKVIVADAADVQVLSGGSVVVKDENQTIVGGMTGGTSSSLNDIIIWAGDTASNMGSAPFRVCEDGSFIATKGSIGGFTIGSDYIESIDGAYDSTYNGTSSKFFLYSSSDGLLGFSSTVNSSGQKWAILGLNCLPLTTEATAMLRIEDIIPSDTEFSYNKIGAYINMKGAHQYDDAGYTNVAIYIPAGKVCGFRPAVRRVKSSRTLSKVDSMIFITASNITLTLPSGCEDGQMYMIQPYGNSAFIACSGSDTFEDNSTSKGLVGYVLYFIIYDSVNSKWSLGYSNV